MQSEENGVLSILFSEKTTTSMAQETAQQRYTYHDLQDGIDSLVGRFGLDKSVAIVKRFTENIAIKRNKNNKLRCFREQVLYEASEAFDLDVDKILDSELQEYREARMICYHILHKYTGNSHAKIAALFGKKRGSACYFINKCDEMLSIPQFHRSLVEKYKTIDGNMVSYLAHPPKQQ